MLRIGRSGDEGHAVFALSGRIGEEDVPELRRMLDRDREAVEVTLDLEELRLVDREVVKFLAECEGRGIKLKNCPSYVREWMGKGANSHEPQS